MMGGMMPGMDPAMGGMMPGGFNDPADDGRNDAGHGSCDGWNDAGRV